jgi:hypothetical protein
LKKKVPSNYFLIPGLDPFLTLKKLAVGIFGFTRCVDWGFHKKMYPKKKTAESVTFFRKKLRCGTRKMRCRYFLIPGLDPFLTLKKLAVGIFGFTRCVDWGFHKKMEPKKKKTAESVTFFLHEGLRC